jgi:hypothetical protein
MGPPPGRRSPVYCVLTARGPRAPGVYTASIMFTRAIDAEILDDHASTLGRGEPVQVAHEP